MAYSKKIIVMSGGGRTGLVKLSGSFDGLNKVKGECACDIGAGGAKLYVIADEVTEIAVDTAKTTFEVPIAARNEISCLLVSGGCTMTGSTGGRADRRQMEGRVEMYRREKMRAVREKRNAAIVSDTGAPRIAAEETPPAANGADTRPSEREAPLPSAGDDAADARCTGAPAAPFSPLRSRAETSASRSVRFDGTNFYQAVKPQIDELFVRYPAEEKLNAIVPNSKWVRVETDADECYVLGVLFDLSLPIFICYGVPGKRSLPPPREIADAAVWLPLSEDSPDGFWVIYQSAADGKCVT